MEIRMYEGYLRNRHRLCAELDLDPGGSRDAVERRILAELWRRMGPDMLPRLYGAFAFALWDETRQELFCARDPFGISGFYYHVTAAGELLYGPDLSRIVNIPGFVRELDPVALQLYMEFGYPVGRDTLYRGVKKLPPGHSLVFRGRECRVTRWFVPAFHPEDDISEEQWIDRIDGTLREILAEDRACYDFSRCCSFLSGGVDSSYLLALSGVKEAVGIGFAGASGETAEAAETARFLGTGFRELCISPEDYFSALPRFVRKTELPLADPAALAFSLGCEQVADMTDACFSGEGADEFFAGYHIYDRAEALSQKGGVWYYGCSGVMEPEAARLLLGQDRCYPRESLVADLSGADPLSHMLGIDISLWLEGDILFGVRSAARSCGPDLLLPFADPRMFALSACIPSGLKHKGDCGKYILRRAAAMHLPRKTALRPKSGFPVPFGKWLMADSRRESVERLLFGGNAATLFDIGLLRRTWDACLAGGRAELQIIFTVYVFLIWYETVFLQSGDTLSLPLHPGKISDDPKAFPDHVVEQIP